MLSIQRENELMQQRIQRARPEYTVKSMKEWYKHHEFFKDGRRSDPTAGHIMNVKKELLPTPLPGIHKSNVELALEEEARKGGGSLFKNSSMSRSKTASRSLRKLNGGESSIMLLNSPPKMSGFATAPTYSPGLMSSPHEFDVPPGNETDVQNGNNLASNGSVGSSTDKYHLEPPSQQFVRLNYDPSKRSSSFVERKSSMGSLTRAGSFRSNGSSPPSSPSNSPVQEGRKSFRKPSFSKKASSSNLTSGEKTRNSFTTTRGMDTTKASSKDIDSDTGGSKKKKKGGDKAGKDGKGDKEKGGNKRNSKKGGADNNDNTEDDQGYNDANDQFEQEVDGDGDNAVDSLGEGSSVVESTSHPNYIVLASKVILIVTESKTCKVEIAVQAKNSDGKFYIRAVDPNAPAGESSKTLVERTIRIDRADIIVTQTMTTSISQAVKSEDMTGLRSLLIDLFNEADDDGNGFLTFDEFQVLMENIELGISPQELRFVIQEADENGNGVVDYDEFVPLAVDLIQSFRARFKARDAQLEEENRYQKQIKRLVKEEELNKLSQACLERLKSQDPHSTGHLRPNEFRKALLAVSSFGLTELEIVLTMQTLPKDGHGKIVYSNIHDALTKARYEQKKINILEENGSRSQKYLFSLCKAEELRLKRERQEEEVITGMLPLRTLLNVFADSRELSLSRLQLLVCMSEATPIEGSVNYYTFIPVVAKAIDLMHDPKTLRQRAELIEKSDLSAEALLKDISPAELEHKLMSLFKSHDLDHSKTLNFYEFSNCLKSLDLEVKDDEASVMLLKADSTDTQELNFSDFCKFVQENLLTMEKEKHLRVLQKMLHKHSLPSGESSDSLSDLTPAAKRKKKLQSMRSKKSFASLKKAKTAEHDYFVEHLLGVFMLEDHDNTGYIDHRVAEQLIAALDIGVSQYQLDVIFSEMETSLEHGMIDYHTFVPVCADMLMAYLAKEASREESELRELEAKEKAENIVRASMQEINSVVRYLHKRIQKIEEETNDLDARLMAFQEILRNRQLGLTRPECNMIMTKLFMPANPHHHFAGKRASFAGTSTRQLPAGLKPKNAPDTSSLGFSAKKERASIVDLARNSTSHEEKENVRKAILENLKAFAPVGGGGGGGNKSRRATSAISHHDDSVHANSSSKHAPLNRASTMFTVDSHGNKASSHGHITFKALSEVVIEARRQSIMRHMLEDVDYDTLRYQMTTLFDEEIMHMRLKGQNVFQKLLPANVCFDVLSRVPNTHLNRSHLLAIMCWSDCHDESSLHLLDYTKFIKFACGIIIKIREGDMLEARAVAMKSLGENDEVTLKSFDTSFEELDNYYILSFSQLEDSDGFVSEENFVLIVKETPKINLTEKEAIIISAAFPRQDGQCHWREFVNWSHGTIATVLRERHVDSTIMDASAQIGPDDEEEEDFLDTKGGGIAAAVAHKSPVKQSTKAHAYASQKTAEKLMDFIRLKSLGGTLTIVLPDDKDTKGHTIARKGSAAGDDFLEGTSVTELLRAALFIPMEYVIEKPPPPVSNSVPMLGQIGNLGTRKSMSLIPPDANSNANSNSNSNPIPNAGSQRADRGRGSFTYTEGAKAGGMWGERPPSASSSSSSSSSASGSGANSNAPTLVTTTIKYLPALVKIVFVDVNPTSSSEPRLNANIVSCDGSYSVTKNLPISLPSLAIVDIDAATTFARALLDKVYIEITQPFVNQSGGASESSAVPKREIKKVKLRL